MATDNNSRKRILLWDNIKESDISKISSDTDIKTIKELSAAHPNVVFFTDSEGSEITDKNVSNYGFGSNIWKNGELYTKVTGVDNRAMPKLNDLGDTLYINLDSNTGLLSLVMGSLISSVSLDKIEVQKYKDGPLEELYSDGDQKYIIQSFYNKALFTFTITTVNNVELSSSCISIVSDDSSTISNITTGVSSSNNVIKVEVSCLKDNTSQISLSAKTNNIVSKSINICKVISDLHVDDDDMMWEGNISEDIDILTNIKSTNLYSDFVIKDKAKYSAIKISKPNVSITYTVSEQNALTISEKNDGIGYNIKINEDNAELVSKATDGAIKLNLTATINNYSFGNYDSTHTLSSTFSEMHNESVSDYVTCTKTYNFIWKYGFFKVYYYNGEANDKFDTDISKFFTEAPKVCLDDIDNNQTEREKWDPISLYSNDKFKYGPINSKVYIVMPKIWADKLVFHNAIGSKYKLNQNENNNAIIGNYYEILESASVLSNAVLYISMK